ncbi:hypothetical protein DERF_001389 [Dermatophagoides farinae]|uniref:Uncharacterized protein n=1 Tax=Dermatophagoides farinae TaxID=6954 RepID=A0A922IDL3_DERFA|nr:hypothetical protein DERF_001389 [Dermatophagoides farinae]
MIVRCDGYDNDDDDDIFGYNTIQSTIEKQTESIEDIIPAFWLIGMKNFFTINLKKTPTSTTIKILSKKKKKVQESCVELKFFFYI